MSHFPFLRFEVRPRKFCGRNFQWLASHRHSEGNEAFNFSGIIRHKPNRLDPKIPQHIGCPSVLSRIRRYSERLVGVGCIEPARSPQFQSLHLCMKPGPSAIGKHVDECPTLGCNSPQTSVESLVTIAITASEYLGRITGTLHPNERPDPRSTTPPRTPFIPSHQSRLVLRYRAAISAGEQR